MQVEDSLGWALFPAGGWRGARAPDKRPAQPLPALPTALLSERLSPDPVRSHAVIDFALAGPAPVSITVFDVQGRRVATLLDHAAQLRGKHEVQLRTKGWSKGFYLYRLEAGPTTTTRKFVVLE